MIEHLALDASLTDFLAGTVAVFKLGEKEKNDSIEYLALDASSTEFLAGTKKFPTELAEAKRSN